MFTSLPESPQGVGDIVGLGCRLVRANIKLIWNFLLVPTVFATVAGIVFQWVITYGVSNWSQSKDVSMAFMLGGLWLVGLIVFAIAWWILGLRLLALVRASLRFSPTLEDAKHALYKKKWAVLGVYFLTFLLLLGGILVCGLIIALGGFLTGYGASIPAALAFTLGFFAFLAVIGLYLLVAHMALVMLACEEDSVIVVMGRSMGLVFKHFWRTAAFGLLFSLTFTVISYPMSLPVAVITFSDAIQHGLAQGGEGYKPPLYVLVLAQTWESLMGMYLRPLVMIAFGLFYYDLRLRSEGLDIKRKLETMLPEAA